MLRSPHRTGRARRWVVEALTAGLVAATTVFVPSVASPAGAVTSGPSVSVVGNRLVNASGDPIRLIGVDRSGTEFACVQGWGIFDGPSDAASVAAMASWHVDAVRVPLNEDCWLGINGVAAAYGGANYRLAIQNYVSELNAAGIIAILDLHWSAPGDELATGQQVMADADHSPAFWTSVATTFRSDPGVVFDLYNEPHDISWSCWLNGCTTSAGWTAAGMQTLVDAVRSTGASQPLMLGGLNWAGDLSGWLANEPYDPDHQLVASAHIYNFSACNTSACWSQNIAPVAAVVPVVTGEIGENDCQSSFINSYMNWADSQGISYLGWTWNTWSCGSGPALITSYDGSPTTFGAGFQSHLAALAAVSTVFAPTVMTGPAAATGSTDTAAPAAPEMDFAGGATGGWHVAWGSSADLSGGDLGLVLGLNGTGYPGFASGSSLPGLAPGSVVTYEIDNPSGSPLAVLPYAQDSSWTVHFAPATTLAPGWNAVAWTVPAESGLEAIGLQVNDSTNFVGQLVLASAAWPVAPPAPEMDFAGGATGGWHVAWGSSADLSGGDLGLVLGLNGTGYPGFASGSSLPGLAPGSVVTYEIDNPSGSPLAVLPYAQDSSWTVHFALATTLAPGWNAVAWTVPAESGLEAIGLQVNDSTNFVGQLVLASAAW